MNRIKPLSLSFLLLAALLTACEVGPDYKSPEAKVMPAYATSEGTVAATQTSIATTRPVQITQWWATFQDPELDSLIARAAKNNLDLKSAASRLMQARAQRGVTGADLFPTINADGGYQRARGSSNVTFPASLFSSALPAGGAATPAISSGKGNAGGNATPAQASGSGGVASNAPLGGPASPLGLGGLPGADTEIYQAGFDASWEIDVFGGLRRATEASDADTQAAIEDRRDVMISMLAEVARNYIELRGYQREEAIAQDNLRAQQDTLELTRSRFKAGFVTQLDVARAAYQVASTAATIPAIEANIRMSIHRISTLLGQDPESLIPELLPPAAIPSVPPEVPIGMPSDLVRRRPDIRRAERQIAAASARVGVATSDLFPKFSLTGSFGLDSTKIKNLPDWSSRYFAISPGVSWPIFDAGRIQNNIHVQDELEKQAVLTYQSTVLNALQEVEDSLTLYRTEQTRHQSLVEAVEAAAQSNSLAKQQYEKGVIDFLSVLDTERSLYDAQDILVQSDRAISTDLVALYKSLGGGWENDTTQVKQ